VNGIRGIPAGPHSKYDRRLAGDYIAACPDTFFGRLAGFRVCNDITPFVECHPLGGLGQEGVGAGAYRYYSRIAFQFKLGIFNRYRPAPARFIRFPQFHPDAFHPFDTPLVISYKTERCSEKIEFDAFLLGMVDFC